VTIKVRQPKESLVRTYTIRRGQHARSTVAGVRKQKTGDWDCILDATAPIAYLRIETISASTPHDLRKLAHQLASRGYYGIILDLRSLWGTSVHPAVLIADALLPGGVIGRVQTGEREETYQADADALFRGLPMAVLVDGSTGGTAEWLAAALQDNKRGMIVGAPTFGAMAPPFGGPLKERSDVRSRISVGDGAWTIELVTGYLKRGDGRRLSPEDRAGVSLDRIPLRTTRNPNDSQTGVKPDHPVNMPPSRVGGAMVPLPSRRRRESNGESDLGTDPFVEEASRLLRQSLQKTI
jgi:Peptidase family S41